MDLQLFQNPPEEYRIHPFWFWNGEMEDSQIELQISEMADKGIGGFFLCARQGMTVPYLSRAWFDKVKYAVTVAERCGMHVWLYDEYPYPSGMAGGQVILEHPDAKHRQLVHKTLHVQQGESVAMDLPWGRLLCASAVPVHDHSNEPDWPRAQDVQAYVGNLQAEPVYQKTGLTAYNQQRFFTYGPIQQLVWKAPIDGPQSWMIHAFLEVEVADFKYYGTFVDPGHHDAIATFIRLTHERYREELGEYFGTTIKGMFTDETGYLGRYPWSRHVSDWYAQRYQRDLNGHLIALVDRSYPDASRIRYEYFQSLHLLLREVYHKQAHDWCEANGLQYVAEVPSMRMSTQLYSHVVGSDSAHDKLGRSLPWALDRYSSSFRSNPKMTSSLARQLNRDRALVESFHSIGWSMTLQDARWMVDRMAAMGVNFFNFHAFFYTLDGMAKHDAPPSQFLQNPYWRYYRQLGDYVGRLGYVMSQGTTACHMAVLDPTTSLWTHLGNPLHGFHYMGNDEDEERRLNELRSDWTEIGKALLLNLHEYDHIDSEILAMAQVRDGVLRIGRAAYSVLVLPPMSNIESAAWRVIQTFLRQGGTVIGMGLLPYERTEDEAPSQTEVFGTFGLTEAPIYPDATSSNAALQTLQPPSDDRYAYFIPRNSQEAMIHSLLALLERVAPSLVHLSDPKAVGNFLVQVRDLDASRLVFISNQSGESWRFSATVRLPENALWVAHILDVETGLSQSIPCQFQDDRASLMLEFAPYESYFLQFARTSERVVSEGSDVPADPVVLSAAGDWAMSPGQPNVVRFESFELTLLTSEGRSTPSVVRAKTFIDQCADLAQEQSLPLQFHQQFGTPMKVSVKYPIACRYRTQFRVRELPSECEVWMDAAAISGEYVLYVNDHPVFPQDFRPAFIYDHQNRAASVSRYIRVGDNELRIELTAKQDWDGVVDPVYLRGDFGVEFEGSSLPVVVSQPQQGQVHGKLHAGYPYYAGTLSFQRSFTVDTLPTTPTFALRFADWDPHFHDCAELLVNGVSIGTRVWSPYVWVGDSRLLHAGDNQLEIRVTNTLAQTIEGRYFDYEDHALVSVCDAWKE